MTPHPTAAQTEHTPGPWHISSSDGRHIIGVPTPHVGVAICSLDPADWDAHDDGDFYHGPVTAANRALIAAAPDMLAALTRMVALFDSGAWSHANIADARAAIAKATGRA